MNSIIASTLSKLDLTEREQELLGAVIEVQELTIADAIKRTKMKRPTAYKIARDLLERGLIQFSGKGKYKQKILPPAPERLLEYAKETTRRAKRAEWQIENHLETLKKLYHSESILPVIRTVHGEEGFIEILEKTIETPNTEIFYIGNIDDLRSVISLEYDAKRYIPERIKKNIFARALLVRTPTAIEFQKTDRREKRETKFFPIEYQPKATMLLWKNSTLIFSGSKEAIALYIESPLISELYQGMFDLLWNQINSPKP